MRPSKSDIEARMDQGVVRYHRWINRALSVVALAGYLLILLHEYTSIPVYAVVLVSVSLLILSFGAFIHSSKDYFYLYRVASDELVLEYDARVVENAMNKVEVVENAMNKVEVVEFKEMIRDPAVMRQLLSAFDHIEVGIENVTVKYRGKEIRLRACRLWRDGDKLRISR